MPGEAAGRFRPRRKQTSPASAARLAPEARRAAILDAALEEFTARGYEGARLDDVAKRAGIAKGTIYLYFADKEALFQDLVRSMVHPVLGVLEQMRDVDIPARMLIETHAQHLRARDSTARGASDIIRLILSEGPALSGDRRILLSRGDRARAGDHAADPQARGRARRTSRRCAGALSAADRRADAGRDHVARAVRRSSSRSTCRRDDARAYRHSVRREGGMRSRAPLLCCSRSRSPPAATRTTAACRAGSRATSCSSGRTRPAASRRSPCARAIRSRPARRCSRSMPTCSRPTCTPPLRRSPKRARGSRGSKSAQQRQEEIAVLEAQEKRAEAMLRSRPPNWSGSSRCPREASPRRRSSIPRSRISIATRRRWKRCAGRSRSARLSAREEDIAAARQTLAAAEARQSAAETKLARRKLVSPVSGAVQQIYFRPGEMVPAGARCCSILPPGNIKLRFFVAQALLPKIALGDQRRSHLRRLRGADRASELHRALGRIYPAGDLQPRRAQQARVHGRGAAGTAGRPARRPAGAASRSTEPQDEMTSRPTSRSRSRA